MSDNTILPGTGETYASEENKDAAGVDVNYQLTKQLVGPPGTLTPISHKDPLPTTDHYLADILSELHVMNVHLSAITSLNPDPDERY